MTSDIAFGSMFLSKIGLYTGSELCYYHIRREILKLKAPLRSLEQSVQALQPLCVYDVSNSERHKELRGESNR